MKHINILVGPNNCGKSTILSAFRALKVAMQYARRRKATIVNYDKHIYGWQIPEATIPMSLENVHTDYTDEETKVEFRFSNGNHLILFFPKYGECCLLVETKGKDIRTPAKFKKAFPFSIASVPILGPLEHEEPIVQEETVKRELFSHRASRHFRNYWHYFPEGFESFAELIRTTWPGMEVLPPEKLNSLSETIYMFCQENRMLRELYWAGFGFQIWCQMLTHVSRASDADILVIDEPEIYLHPEIQRQLLDILRSVGPDILIATHSTEIMSEADPSEIILIEKEKRSGKRLIDIDSVQNALNAVGSVQNITLTHLARSRRVIFVEDDEDFRIIRRFAKIYGYSELASGIDLTPVKSEGFSSWKRISAMSWGLERTLGKSLKIGVIFDRDYYAQEQLDEIRNELIKSNVSLVHFHQRKEIENYLLEPDPLQRAFIRALKDRKKRTKMEIIEPSEQTLSQILDQTTNTQRQYVSSQLVAKKCDYLKHTGADQASITQDILSEINAKWQEMEHRLQIIPGKTVLHEVRNVLQEEYDVSLTNMRIVNAFKKDEIPHDMVILLQTLENFRTCEADL